MADMSTVEADAVGHFRAINDKAGEGRLLCALGRYFHHSQNDLSKALVYFEHALALTREGDDPPTQCLALRDTTGILWQLGRYHEAQDMAREIQHIAKLHGLFYYEVQGIRQEFSSLMLLGNLKHCVGLLVYAQELLDMCGLQGGTLDLLIQSDQAEVHFQKTEYIEAREVYSRTILKESPLGQAYDRLNILQIDIEMGHVDTSKLRNTIMEVQSAFTMVKHPRGGTFCNVFLAFVDICDGYKHKACVALEKVLAENRTIDQEVTMLVLNKLADPDYGMNNTLTTFGWALVLLGSALKGQNKIAIHHALRCLGDIFIVFQDEDSALNLFRVAFEAFTAIGVHRSQGE
ncbi:hypothetical protein C8F01DRAFT_1230838, partial [Mycena amicta]